MLVLAETDAGQPERLSHQVDLLMSFRSATLLRVWQYIPVAFLFVPLTLAGYVGLAPEKTNAAAGS
jgi:MFS transporter, DHA2 family, multidrug resistance protein